VVIPQFCLSCWGAVARDGQEGLGVDVHVVGLSLAG